MIGATMELFPEGDIDRDALIEAVCASSVRPDDDALLMAGRFGALGALERIALLHRVSTVEDLCRLSHRDVETIIGRRMPRAEWTPDLLRRQVEVDLRWKRRGTDRFIVWIGDKEYPESLRRIFDPPATLYGWGNRIILNTDGGIPSHVAVVGTRRPDKPGMLAAYMLGREFTDLGVPVVSGLARGIDGAAHRGVVSRLGRAVVVLGSGIDTIYPREHRSLAADILNNGGVLMSEYPAGVAPAKFRFPGRNRIIVGLSAATVVVQAPEGSGALISSDFAADIGEDVCVHEVGKGWSGTDELISGGAPVVKSAADVLQVLGTAFRNYDDRRDDIRFSARGGEMSHPALAAFGSVTTLEQCDDIRDGFRHIVGQAREDIR